MKNIKYFNLIIYLFLISIFLSGCLDNLFTQRDRTYKGKNEVEFKPITKTVNQRSNENDSAVVVSPLIQLISSKGTLNTDISIEYAADDSSTALAGTDYTISTPSPVNITSGTVSTHLDIKVTADELQNGDTRILYISLKDISGADVEPSANYKKFTLIIRGR